MMLYEKFHGNYVQFLICYEFADSFFKYALAYKAA